MTWWQWVDDWLILLVSSVHRRDCRVVKFDLLENSIIDWYGVKIQSIGAVEEKSC